MNEEEYRDITRRNRNWRMRLLSFFRPIASRRTISGPVSDLWSDSRVYTKESLVQIVKDIPEVRGAITIITDAVVGEWKFFTRDKSDDLETENIAVKKITDWAEYPDRNFNNTLRKIMYNILIRGNCFVEIVPAADVIPGDDPWFYVLNSRYCRLLWNDTKTRVIGMEYKHPEAEKSMVLDNDHFAYMTIDDFDAGNEGFPPVQTLLEDANLEAAAMNYIKNYFKQGGVGRQAFIIDGSEDEYEAMKADIRESRGGSIALLGEVKILPLSTSPKEMEYSSISEGFVQKIMTLMRIPPIMMSRPGSSFKETSKTEMNAFSSRIRADKRGLHNFIDRICLKIWGDEYSNIRFKTAIWIDPLTQAEIQKLRTEIGAITVNEIRNELDMNPVKWGDIPFNFNLWPQIAWYYDDNLPDSAMPSSPQEDKNPGEKNGDDDNGKDDLPSKEEIDEEIKRFIKQSQQRNDLYKILEEIDDE